MSQLLNWRGFIRVLLVYFVLMGIYNYGLGGESNDAGGLLINTVVMAVVLSVATMGVLFIITISNRGGVAAFLAQRQSRSGRNEGALNSYNGVLQRNASNPEALVGRAELLEQAGQVAQARADLDKAIAETPHVINFPNPLLLKAYTQRGRLRDMAGDKQGALEDWQQASRAVSGAPEPYILRGRAALEQSDWIVGRRSLLQGIQLLDRQIARESQSTTDRAAQLNMRGLAFNLLGDYKKAMADLEQALAIAPNSWVAHFNLGATYLNMGFIDQSLAELSSAIKLNPAAAAAAQQSRSYARLSGDDAFEALVGQRAGIS